VFRPSFAPTIIHGSTVDLDGRSPLDQSVEELIIDRQHNESICLDAVLGIQDASRARPEEAVVDGSIGPREAPIEP
jgi:hypothetical protein